MENIKTFIEPFVKLPYIDGKDFGIAEVLTAPFVVRLYAGIDAGFFGSSLAGDLKGLKFDTWARKVIERPSVKSTFVPLEYTEMVKRRVANAKK